MKPHVSHNGRIEEISEKHIIVGFIQKSACASCHVKGVCNATDTQKRTVEIPNNKKKYADLTINQEVKVIISQGLGLKATLLGYFLPFLLLSGGIIVGLKVLHIGELKSALIGLGILFPYYTTIYLLRKHLKKTFSFALEKI